MQTTVETTVQTVKLSKARFLIFRAMEKVQERAKRMADKLDTWKNAEKAQFKGDTDFVFKSAGESEQKVASIRKEPGKRLIDLEKLEKEYPAAYFACVTPGNPVRKWRWH